MIADSACKEIGQFYQFHFMGAHLLNAFDHLFIVVIYVVA